MDSKTKRLTLICILSITVLVVLVVILMNYQFPSRKTATQQQEEEIQTQEALLEEDGKVKGADLSAFLRDNDFFDEDKASQENTTDSEQTQQTSQGQSASLLATSIEKDLRVRVVDEDGNPIAGYPFALHVEDVGDYKDLDEDGLIYIADLKPGEYQVTLQELDGFQVPKEPLQVRVKAIVSYLAIDDISYLIRSEDEIDASIEDTQSEGQAEIESDASQYTSLLDTQELGAAVQLGIDVSKWNGEIDWEVVKAEGVDFAIIRCGYRGSSSGWLIEDPYFYQNLTNAQKAGVKVGVYFFTQATSMVEAVEEASTVISLLGDSKLEYPVFIDTEGAGGNGRADGLDADTRTLVCNAFCKTIENAGYQAGIYASRNWYYHNLNVEELGDYKIWLAEYRNTPLYENRYDMWQYTSSGSVAGINGRVDLNVSYLQVP